MSPLEEALSIALASTGLCLLVGSWAVRALARAQCIAPIRYEDCPPLKAYQETKAKVPTMGGLFVLAVGIGVAVVAGGLADSKGWLVLGAVVGLGTVGALDDCWKFRRANAKGLPGTVKLFLAFAVGAGVGMGLMLESGGARSLSMPGLQSGLALGWWWIPFAMVVLAGCAHAVNLADGMDGLAAGCVAIALSAVGGWALVTGSAARVAVPWCASFAGACLGFLWFNSFPASVVLGDVGALGLGAALGAVSLLTGTSLWLLLIGGVFVIEALSVMLQVASYQWRGQRRIFRVAPLHHHFHLGGMSEPKVIVRFWIIGALLALVALTTMGLLS